ncbi:MAG: AIR synthase-related protein [Saprospiraceae bacterium]
MIEESLKNKVSVLMKTLNKQASEIMLKYNANACTDVTGFGLIGHLSEMTKSSQCDVELFFNEIPFLEEVRNMASANIIPGGTYNNYDYTYNNVDYGNHSKIDSLMLCDSQTSGGLLIAMNEQDAKKYISELKETYNFPVAIIGKFTQKGSGKIYIH